MTSSRSPGFLRLLGAIGVAVAPTPTTASAQPGDAGCRGQGGAAVLVSVAGLKPGGGNLRVQAYGPDPATFLQKGRWVRRVDVAAPGRGGATVCLTLPRAGRYAIAVRHDANGNRKSDWNDGGGFSRNPRLSLLRLKPKFEAAAVAVPAGVLRVGVTMNYRSGLSIGPVD